MRRTLIVIVLIIISGQVLRAQTDTASTLEFRQSFFANIFTAFYYSPGEKAVPGKGFEFSTGLFGYKAQWGDRATGTLIYDVYRTTDNIHVVDSNNNPLAVSYFRGSDYTGFLKMAQIDFRVNSWLEFSAGQLLNQQYLTYQDRFWGFRYISTTFQELYRFGAPADFGARVTFTPLNTLNISVGTVNGNGPFRMQSDDGNLQHLTNIEWAPFKGYIIKLFADHAPVSGRPARNAISLFTGYKTTNWRLGFEANHVANHENKEENDLSGFSTYGALSVARGWNLLARHDYIIKSMALERAHYLIAGVEYEPYKGFYTSLNYRFLSKGDVSWIYASFGAKF